MIPSEIVLIVNFTIVKELLLAENESFILLIIVDLFIFCVLNLMNVCLSVQEAREIPTVFAAAQSAEGINLLNKKDPTIHDHSSNDMDIGIDIEENV